MEVNGENGDEKPEVEAEEEPAEAQTGHVQTEAVEDKQEQSVDSPDQSPSEVEDNQKVEPVDWEDLLGASNIAPALPCKELFALRLASKTALQKTNRQIEERLKQLWLEAVRPSPRKSPTSSRSEKDEDDQLEASSPQQSPRNEDVSPQKSAPHDVPIFLNIYDVTHYAGVQWLNCLFANQYSPVKLGGIFHIGVQIGQKEWSYGYKAEGTGVFWTPPLFQAAHHFRESVPMGLTKLSTRRIASVITELEAEWTGPSYNVLGRNCCHFADALCQRLDIGHVPEWTCRDLSN